VLLRVLLELLEHHLVTLVLPLLELLKGLLELADLGERLPRRRRSHRLPGDGRRSSRSLSHLRVLPVVVIEDGHSRCWRLPWSHTAFSFYGIVVVTQAP